MSTTAVCHLRIPHHFDVLSFTKRQKDRGGGDHWSVQSSGHYSADFEAGRELAKEYVRFIGMYPTAFNSTLLGWIVNDMVAAAIKRGEPRESSRYIDGVAIGFLHEVSTYAMGAATWFHADERGTDLSYDDPADQNADPLAELIAAYRVESAALNASPDDEPFPTPIFDQLDACDFPAPTTRAGALEALRLAIDEEVQAEGVLMNIALMKAALAFFERNATVEIL